MLSCLRSLWARPPLAVTTAAAVAAVSGLLIAAAMPRGPVTAVEALSLLLVDAAVGLACGVLLRSRWALLVAPVVQISFFELGRLGASGPTVDGISIDGLFGPLSFIVGRGFYGIAGVLPMVVGAAYGAALARRVEALSPRGRRRRIGLYLRRTITGLAAAAVAALAGLLMVPAS